MSDRPAFNAYQRWLGIPAEEQPPDHYRLLGLNRLEADSRVIEDRANERIRLVNGYRRGPHVKACDQIVQHIKVARACLVNPALKAAYDRSLKPPAQPPNGDVDAWFDENGGPRLSKGILEWLPEDAGYEVLAPQNGEASAETEASNQDDGSGSQPNESPLGDEAVDEGSDPPRRKSPSRILLGLGGLVAVGALGFLLWNQGLLGESRSVSEPVPPPAAVQRPIQRPAPRLPDAPRIDAPLPAVQTASSPKATAPEPAIEIGVAYGTEKRYWLEWAAREFGASEEGKQIRVNLIPMGSLEGAHAVIDGDARIHVWTPASSLYRETFLRDWQARHHGNPIAKEESLARTPMVIVMWKQRYEAFTARAPEVSFKTMGFAMNASSGWGQIAGKPEWGRFKLGHAHPNQSNSGLMTLVILAHEYFGKNAGLAVSDVMAPEFQKHLERFAQAVHGLSNSTGNMMKEMILKGPSGYDALVVYESVAIEFLASAEGRWDQLQVVYPKYNLWSDNPYYILNTPWSTPEHRKAAEAFLRYLMGDAAQKRALDHGFRPGNSKAAAKGSGSPLARYAKYGLRVDLPEVCQVPSADVLDNLLQSWIRTASRP